MEMTSARLLQPQPLMRATRTAPTPREIVADHFRARANGVPPSTAQERTKWFFRSSRQPWSLALL